MKWICLDIETADAPEAAIQATIETWKAPSTWKAETANTKRQEAAAKIRVKAALLDASPIICVTVITSTQNQVVINGMDAHCSPPSGWDIFPAGNERNLLIKLRLWLNAMIEENTIIVGHNHTGFDLPKLRQAYIRHRLMLPNVLRPRTFDELPILTVDTMYLVRSFSMELRDERFISLDSVAQVLGIDRAKQFITGADIPGLYRQGRYQEITTYCAIDTATTTRAYLLMTGQAPDLK